MDFIFFIPTWVIIVLLIFGVAVAKMLFETIAPVVIVGLVIAGIWLAVKFFKWLHDWAFDND